MPPECVSGRCRLTLPNIKRPSVQHIGCRYSSGPAVMNVVVPCGHGEACSPRAIGGRLLWVAKGVAVCCRAAFPLRSGWCASDVVVSSPCKTDETCFWGWTRHDASATPTVVDFETAHHVVRRIAAVSLQPHLGLRPTPVHKSWPSFKLRSMFNGCPQGVLWSCTVGGSARSRVASDAFARRCVCVCVGHPLETTTPANGLTAHFVHEHVLRNQACADVGRNLLESGQLRSRDGFNQVLGAISTEIRPELTNLRQIRPNLG